MAIFNVPKKQFLEILRNTGEETIEQLFEKKENKDNQ